MLRGVVRAYQVVQVFAIITLVFESLAVKNGIGTHKMYLSEAGAIEAAKWATLAITPNLLATMMARISLCLLMLRIVGKAQPYHILLVSIIVLTAAIGTLACINTYITCKPVPKIWNSALPGTCDPDMRHAIGLAQAVWSIGSDWLVAFFPLLILKNLQMAIRTKVALAIIMGLGFLSVCGLSMTLIGNPGPSLICVKDWCPCTCENAEGRCLILTNGFDL